MHIYDNIALNSSSKRNISYEACRENQNTHFMFNKFFYENSVVYDMMWKNMADPDRQQTTISRNLYVSRQ
jgi:hypothetical protein